MKNKINQRANGENFADNKQTDREFKKTEATLFPDGSSGEHSTLQ